MRIKRRRFQPRQRVCTSTGMGAAAGACNRFRPFARTTLAVIHLDPAGTPRWPGVHFAKLPARRYGACAPELTASRRPKLRQPRPSVCDGRSGECGMGGEGVEKMEGFFGWRGICTAHELAYSGGSPFWRDPSAQTCQFQRRVGQAAAAGSVCAELCICFRAPSCSRRIATLRRLALKPTSNRSPITGTRPIT